MSFPLSKELPVESQSTVRRWWTLAAVVFAVFVTTLDNTVVNVALPSIQHDLHLGLSGLAWVVNAYILSFAVLLLTGAAWPTRSAGGACSCSGSPASRPPRCSRAWPPVPGC